MGKLWIGSLLIALLAASGCGPDKTEEEIRNLRRAGQFEAARGLALSTLEAKANRPAVWREFIRNTAELSRQTGNDAEAARPYVIQAGLAFDAFYEFAEHRLDGDWKEIGQAVASETVRQVNILLRAMQDEAQVAHHYRQLSEMTGTDSNARNVLAEDAEHLSNIRADAKYRIEDTVILRFLLERQPEISPGMRRPVLVQFDAVIEEWQEALELPPEYVRQAQSRAETAMKTAFSRALGDLKELGYLLPRSIIENEVVE